MGIKFPAASRLSLLIIVLMGLCSVFAFSQEAGSCAEKLKSAQSLFEKGQVEQVPSMLGECMRSGFNREESLAAYKLLIQSFLFEDKLTMADSAILVFLKNNPEYELSPTDHSSFVHLFNNFRVNPIVLLSLHFGTNIPFLTMIEPNPVASEYGSHKYRSELVNLNISLEAKFEIDKKIEINIEPGYSQLSFTNVREFMGIGKTTYIESQKRIELPVSATYNFKNFGKFTPYGRLGCGPALSLGVTATADFKPSDLNGTPHTGSDINRGESRILLDLFAQAGAGLKFKIKGGYIFTELRTNIGFFNQVVRAGTTPEEQELAFYYFYADEDFNLNALNFSVGYTRIFYKPSKRK